MGMAVAVVGLWKLFKLLFPSTDCWGFQLQVSLRGGSAGWLAQPRDGCWWYFRRAPLTDNINVERVKQWPGSNLRQTRPQSFS